MTLEIRTGQKNGGFMPPFSFCGFVASAARPLAITGI